MLHMSWVIVFARRPEVCGCFVVIVPPTKDINEIASAARYVVFCLSSLLSSIWVRY